MPRTTRLAIVTIRPHDLLVRESRLPLTVQSIVKGLARFAVAFALDSLVFIVLYSGPLRARLNLVLKLRR